MSKIRTLFAIGALLGLSVTTAFAADHQILVCVSDTASPETKALADDLAKSSQSVPALKALIDTQHAGPIVRMSSEAVLKDVHLAANNHLVVIGLADSDPLMAKVWDHYVGVDEPTKTLYAQGWGRLSGDIGIVASDWNPFLHSGTVASAPYETVEFKLSGTDTKGVLAAVSAFRNGLNNGLVPAGSFTRPETTLLDLDPYTSASAINFPATLPAEGGSGNLEYAGWTQVPGNEYRAYLDAASHEPLHVWRVKYLQSDVLNQPWTPQAWVDGFHPMAYGNAVTIAQFASASDAAQTATAIGTGHDWRKSTIAGIASAWETDQPIDEVLTKSYGKITVFAHGDTVIFSSLPLNATAQIVTALH